MAGEEAGEARAALVVATWEYDDERFRRLRSPSHDADRLAELLAEPSLGGFDVEVLRNQGVLQVKRRIETFLRARGRNDLTLLYFSGHGVLDERNRYFIAAVDTEMEALAATGIDRDFVNARMDDCRCRRMLLLLDTCHSGAFAKELGFKGTDRPPVAAGFSGAGRVVISASGPLEPAFEGTGDAGDPSVFTAALVRGLETGAADRDDNALVTVDELFNYLCEEVTGQEPQFSGQLSGRMVISQVPAHRRKPAPLPADIEQAMASDDRNARLGAVVRLENLLADPDPTVAAAARLGLTRIADDDSRLVADAASAALGRHESASSLASSSPGSDPLPAAATLPPPARVPASPPPASQPDPPRPTSAPARVELRAEDPRTPPCITSDALGGHVNAVAFSPDGTMLAAGTSKPSLVVRQLATGARVRDRSGFAAVNDCAWSPDGSLLAAVMGGKARTFNVADGFSEVIGSAFAHGWSVTLHGIAFAPDGAQLATGGSAGTRWWGTDGQPTGGHLDPERTVFAVAVDPTGSGLVASGGADGDVHLHRMPEGNLIRELEHDTGVRAVAFSPDGALLACGTDLGAEDGTLYLWDVATGDRVSSVSGLDTVRSVAFDPAGRFLVSGGDSNEAVVWPLTSEVRAAVCPHPNWVYGVAVSPDGRRVATGCRDKVLRMFDLGA